MTNKDTKDISLFLETCTYTVEDVICYIENVHSMKGQGVASSFSFGKNFGILIGILVALDIEYELVTPQKWKKSIGCLAPKNSTKTQKKNIDKAKAQQLFTDIKITHAIADALLIAEYGRRLQKGML